MEYGTDTSQTAEDALEQARQAGIHLLALPTPFAIGDVNCYLIEDDPLTLVDCGPNSATALFSLEDQLAARGHALADIDLLLITHQHVDHMGLAHAFARNGHTEVACLDRLAPVLERWEHHGAQDDDDALVVMQRHGVEDHVSQALRAIADTVRCYGASSPVHRRLRAGEVLELRDRTFTVLHLPGHSPSDTVFHDAERRLAVAGDHLMSEVSSNALVSRPLDRVLDGQRPQPLRDYRSSLRATADLGLELVLGGHRSPVTNPTALVTARLADHEQRAESFYEQLSDGPRSAHEIATATWGSIAVTQAFLTLSEVLGHLDLLIEDGRVVEDLSEHVIRFTRT